MGRALSIYGALLAGLAALWIGVAAFSVGGLHGLANMDSRNPPGSAPLSVPPFRAFKNRGLSLLWFGDSVSTVIRRDDAADARTPCLLDLVRSRFTRHGGAKGRAWRVWTFQQSGYEGLRFLQYARFLRRAGQFPDVAVVGVNMRSLNRLGKNGFLGPSPGDLVLTCPRVPPIDILYRGLAAWTHAMVHSVFYVEPKPLGRASGALNTAAADAPNDDSAGDPGDALPGNRAPRRRAEVERLGVVNGYKLVYGQGYGLNPGELAALADTGAVLRAGGTLVLYYITPLDGPQLRAREGKATADAMERSVQEVVVCLRTAGFHVLDEHALLREGFMEPPSEHLDAQARLKLAGVLVPWVKAAAAGR